MAPGAEVAGLGRPPIGLFNAAVLPGPGRWELNNISAAQAAALVAAQGYRSAIGHAATAQLLSQILGIECPVDRHACQLAPGEQAIVLRLAQRLDEGVVLGAPRDIEALGYKLALLTRLPDGACTGGIV